MPADRTYSDYLSCYLHVGYEFHLLGPTLPRQMGAIYLRHDIDFDCEIAVLAAEVEASLGICSSYFFLLTSDSYNLLAPRCRACVKKVQDLGHKVSLHFDPTIYKDSTNGLEREARIFEDAFETKVDLISIHRPSQEMLRSDRPLGGISHTYEPAYRRRIHYYSDSQGTFRYGDPVNSDAFTRMESIQLLLHPIWWFTSGSPQAQIEWFLAERTRKFTSHVAENCTAFDPRSFNGMDR